MAKKEQETGKSASSTHVTASGRTAGGRGGSFSSANPPAAQAAIANTMVQSAILQSRLSGTQPNAKTIVTAAYPAAFNSSPVDAIQKGETVRAVAQAQRGLATYISDFLQSNSRKQQSEKMRLPSAPADSPGIVHAFQSAADSYRRDSSYREINPDWSFQDKLKFGYLYDKDPKEAQRYAIGVNNDLALAQTAHSRSEIQKNAAQNLRSGLLHTAGALGLSSLLPMGEALDRAAQLAARGTTTEKRVLTPWDYVQEVKSGIRDQLNTHTLDESIPVLGGKGWGDLYALGFEVAEGWLSANTIGRAYGSAGKLAAKAALHTNAFARSATAALDAARRSGADGSQSAAFGLAMGLIEAAVDSLPTEKLLGMKPATTVREFLTGALKHGALEGSADALAEGLGQAAEYAILGDSSTFAQRRAGYLHQGFSPEEASRKALRDSVYDLGFTMLTGTAAGTAAAGAQYASEGHLAKLRESEAALQANHFSLDEPFQLRRDLRDISQSPSRFTPEGQRRWADLSQRYAQLQTKTDNIRKALADRDTHLAAFRQALRDEGSPKPFSPELYRLAAEMSAPYGYEAENYGNDLEGRRAAMVNSPGEIGEKAIPYSDRGIEIEPRIIGYMEKLASEGAYITDAADTYKLEDLQIMTAETGVEFTLINVDGKSYLIRGSERGTPIPEELAEALYNKQGDFVCHTHPYIGDLKPSQSDLEFMKSLTWQTDSIIMDPYGEITIFDKNGVKEKKTISISKDEDYYQKMFGEGER